MTSRASATAGSKFGNRSVEDLLMTAKGPKVNLRDSTAEGLPLICSESKIAANSPPLLKSGRTEVNVGIVCSQISCTSSTLIIASSSGIFIFEIEAAVIISAAVASLAAKSAHGLGIVERKVLNSRWYRVGSELVLQPLK